MIFGEACSACGKSKYDSMFVLPEPQPFTPVFPLVGRATSDYCVNCGEYQMESCYSCGGSGKEGPLYEMLPLALGPKYCGTCGRQLRADPPKPRKCGTCGGEGRVAKQHVCKEKFRPW